MPLVGLDLLELGRVLHRVAARVEEVGERVVAGVVAARSPDLLDARAHHAAGAAHVLVEAAHLEGDVVDRGVRAAAMRQAVVPVVAPHEVHHLAHVLAPERVRELEAEHVGVEVAGRVGVVAVHHRVRDADRDRLALLDRAVLPGLDVGGDLDGAAVDVEEPEAVAAAGGLQLAGLADQLDPGRAEVLGQRVHCRAVSAPNAIRSSRFSWTGAAGRRTAPASPRRRSTTGRCRCPLGQPPGVAVEGRWVS